MSARVIRAAESATPLSLATTQLPQPKRVSRFVLEAQRRAEQLVAEAEARAEQHLAAARREAEQLSETVARETKAAEEAKLAAQFLALSLERDRLLAESTERLVQLATLLAERVLGTELQQHPQQIANLARTALAEARGVGALTIEAHPADVEALRALLEQLRPGAQLSLRESDALERGSLLVHTELGTLDARLRPQLERLAVRLRELLGAG